MAVKRRGAARVDGNHAEIVRALRAAGCGVVDLSAVGGGVPDLLVHGPAYPECRMAILMEVKDGRRPPSGRKLTKVQRDFHAQWKGGLVVVTSVAEALAAVGVGRGA